MEKNYKKKPVIVQAVQWNGQNQDEILSFINFAHECAFFDEFGDLYIHTLEGKMRAKVGDYIIRGIKGEFYPCKPNIFELTYEEVN